MLKNDFPIFVHNPDLVYLDSAATTLKPSSVIKAVDLYYQKFSSNSHRGIYSLAEKTTEYVEETREVVAKFINSSKHEVAFTSGATDSINKFYYGFLKNVPKNSRVVLLESEHNSHLLPAKKWCDEFGLKLEIVEISNNLEQIEEDLLSMLDNQTVLLGLSMDSNVMPLNLNFETIISRCNGLGIKVFLDACQTVSHSSVDVKKLKVDALAFSAHKIYGPTGIGVLFVKEDLIYNLEPLIVGGGTVDDFTLDNILYVDGIQKLEAGTQNMAGIFGLRAAIDYVNQIGYKKIQKHLKSLIDYISDNFLKLDFIETYPANISKNKSLVSFNIKNVHPHDVAMVLDQENICVRASKHCTHLLHDRLDLNASLRVSFGLYNQKEDVDKLIAGLKEANKLFNSENE